jgi:hypothetical protein
MPTNGQASFIQEVFMKYAPIVCIAIAAFLIDASAARAEVCPLVFKPVCAEKHGGFKTYTNACFARVAHASVIANCSCVKH